MVKFQVMLILVIVSVHMWIQIPAIHAAAITLSPRNQVAFSSIQSVLFSCEAEDVLSATWIINDTYFSNLSSFLHADMEFTRITNGMNIRTVLTVQVKPVYNGTSVQCSFFGTDNGLLTSQKVSLMLQGVLPSVHMYIVSNTSSITISWSAPFSLDVTGVDPDIWYSVLIYNETDGDNPTAVPCIDCYNLTQTHYIFIPDYPSPCHKYTFTLIPQNGVGNGTPTENIVAYLYQAPPGIQVSEANITVSKRSAEYSVSITIPLLHTSVLCFGQRPNHLNVYYNSDQQHCPAEVLDHSPKSSQSETVWQIQSVVQLKANCNYTVHIVSINNAGATNSSGQLSFSTTVISVYVDQQNDRINVLCVFQHTISDKCYIQLVSDVMNEFYKEDYVEGEVEAYHSFTGLESGTYTVLVYGLESDAESCSPLHDPDYSTVVSVSATHLQLTTVPTMTIEPSPMSETTSNALCIEGLAVGCSVGIVATALVNLVVIIVIKIIPRCRHVHKRDVPSLNLKRAEVSMESNKAYELHNPVLQRASSGKAQTSQSKPPIYEEIPKSQPPIYEVPN